MLHALEVRRGAAAAVALLALAGAAACGGDPEPVIAAPPPTPPTSSAAPTPVAETPPADETPEDFIRRWVATDVAMQNSGDSAAYRAITEGCRPCARLARRVEGFYAAGGYVRSTLPSNLSVTRFAANDDSAVLDVSYDAAPTAYAESSTAPEQELAGGRATYRVTVDRDDTGWRVVDASGLGA